jgi:dihydroxyacetone kinase-like protein
MKDSFANSRGIRVLEDLITAVRENKQYLSDIDGMIGDGDHGVNMDKGFSICRDELDKDPGDLAHGMNILSRVLMMRIGGSMGPLYGKFFKSFSTILAGRETIDAGLWEQALSAARDSVAGISRANVGDKTLVDALFPAVDAYTAALAHGKDFAGSLADMKLAAETGRDATENMIARIGRSSRLGERSRGVIDAGAASCALILGTMADTIRELLNEPS